MNFLYSYDPKVMMIPCIKALDKKAVFGLREKYNRSVESSAFIRHNSATFRRVFSKTNKEFRVS